MKIKTILITGLLALCLGATPQAQGMGYFKAAYQSAYSWGKKALTSTAMVKDHAIARIAALVNHLVPQSSHKTINPEKVAINRIKKAINQLPPEQQNNALKRTQILIRHLAPQEQELITPNVCSARDNKFNEIDYQLRDYINMHGTPSALSSLLEILSNNEIGQEEIFDTNNNKMGILYFYKIQIDTGLTLVITRLANNDDQTIGFCIGRKDTDSTNGYIAYLLISQNERRNGYGQILLAHNARLLYQIGCTNIHGSATSFDLKAGENQQTMQAKLENFYGQFGAQSLDGSTNKLGLSLL